MVTYLLKNPHQPARLDATDSLGNTVLHALIMIADNSTDNTALVINMYDRLLQEGADLCPTVQLEEICNHQGLTPLKLAAKEGKIEVSAGCPSPCLSWLQQASGRQFPEDIIHSASSHPGPFIISLPSLSTLVPYIPFSHSVLFVLPSLTELTQGHLCGRRFQTIHWYHWYLAGSQDGNDCLSPRTY